MDRKTKYVYCFDQQLKNRLTYLNLNARILEFRKIWYKMHIIFLKYLLIILRQNTKHVKFL